LQIDEQADVLLNETGPLDEAELLDGRLESLRRPRDDTNSVDVELPLGEPSVSRLGRQRRLPGLVIVVDVGGDS